MERSRKLIAMFATAGALVGGTVAHAATAPTTDGTTLPAVTPLTPAVDDSSTAPSTADPAATPSAADDAAAPDDHGGGGNGQNGRDCPDDQGGGDATPSETPSETPTTPSTPTTPTTPDTGTTTTPEL